VPAQDTRTAATLRLWAPVVAWAAVIFALSSIPDLGTGLGTWDLILRKLAHAAEFALLGALLARALRDDRLALAAGIAYAASDELHQHFVPGRVGSPLDVAIDSAGVALGILAWRRCSSRWASR
jgi:VanZ family protein